MMGGNAMGQVHFKTNAEENSRNIIEVIASETNRPFDEVKRVYDDEFARLKSDAQVFDYLVLFAARRTRIALGRPH